MLRRPLCRGMFGDAEVKNSSPLMFHDEKYKQYPQADRRYGKEVNRNDFAEMIPQEGSPRLRWRSLDRSQETGHSAFRNRDSELLQFPMNPRCPPRGVREGHRLNQLADLAAD